MNKLFILKDDTIKENAARAVKDSPFGKEVVIRDKRKSNLQERYFHAILDCIEAHTGHESDYLKTRIKAPILGYDVVTVNGERIAFVKSSKNITTEQYTKLIEAAKIMADSLGVMLPPAKYYYGY